MGVFDSLNDASGKAMDSGERYLVASREYFKLKIFQQVSKSFSFIGKLVLIGGLLLLGLIFLAVASVIWLGDLLDSIILACLVVALFFFVCGFIVYLFRKQLDTVILKKLSNEFFD